MEETDIIRTLQQAVTAAVAASTSPSLPVYYLDIPFTIPNDKKWLEVVWLPNNRLGDFWGNEKQYQGIMRLVLHWPNTQSGSYAPLDLLASISGYFDKNRLLPNVKIYEIADFTGILRDGDERLYPVSIFYQSFRS